VHSELSYIGEISARHYATFMPARKQIEDVMFVALAACGTTLILLPLARNVSGRIPAGRG